MENKFCIQRQNIPYYNKSLGTCTAHFVYMFNLLNELYVLHGGVIYKIVFNVHNVFVLSIV